MIKLLTGSFSSGCWPFRMSMVYSKRSRWISCVHCIVYWFWSRFWFVCVFFTYSSFDKNPSHQSLTFIPSIRWAIISWQKMITAWQSNHWCSEAKASQHMHYGNATADGQMQ
jgi:hypothetical protein